MRLFVLQNGLASHASHYFNESLAWRTVAAARGLPCRIYAHRKASAAIAEQLGAVPCFSFGPDDAILFDKATQPLHDLVDKSDWFGRECRLIGSHGAGANDVVVVPYAGGAEMLGLARWIESRPSGTRPRAVAVLHRPPDDWRLDGTRSAVVAGQTGPLRYAALRLERAAGEGRFLLAATNGRLARLLADVTDLPAVELPVMWHHPLAAAAARSGEAPTYRGRRYDLGLLGEFRAEKGGAVALQVLRRCLARHRRLGLAIQVADRDQVAAVETALRGAGGDVTVLAGQMSAGDFEACIGACRLLLLPYVPQRYAARVSGLMIEAAAWGRPVVAPADTWMADMIGQGRAAGVLFDRFAADEIEAALERALAGLETLAARAEALAPAWRASQSMERAVDDILAWAGLSPAASG